MVHAQTIKFHIKGNVEDTSGRKFAYLTTLSQRVPVSSDKVHIMSPVDQGTFEFEGEFDLRGKDYQYANIFILDRSNISKEEVASKFKNLIWVSGRDSNLVEIVLEDMMLQINKPNLIKNAQINSGGKYTNQLREKDVAMETGNKALLKFLKKYPDSPVSFEQVESIISTYLTVDETRRQRLQSVWGSAQELYSLLSNRLKNSKRGISLKGRIQNIGKS
jgi:hypothetical protein